MGSEQHVQLWDRCLTIIKDNINEEAFDSLFKPIVSLGFDDNVLTLLVPSHFVIEQIEEHYLSLLKKVLPRIYGASVKLLYRVQIVRQPEATVDLTATTKSTAVKKMQQSMPDLLDPFKQRVYDELDPRLNPIYTFESYYQGASNMLARTAAESIAANPGRNTFNPLFLFGESGVGKTHLIQAIGLRIKENNPASRVLYLSAHDFLVQYTDAVRNNRVNDFISFYQSIDVLLMDDIQEFAGKTQTQNTFFHIFNHLHLLGKQLIMTSDKAPVDLHGMEERLFTRLKWGLTAELERPDLDLRKKILKNKISHDGVVIPDDVFNFIASNVTENVRDVEGIVASLLAYSTAFNRMIDLPLTKQVVSRVVKLEKKQVSVESIQDVVCKYYNLELAAIQTNSRKREIVQARQVTMYLAKKYTDSSFSHIGKIVGKRDHATVLHACKTVKDQIETNKSFRSSVEEIEALLKA